MAKYYLAQIARLAALVVVILLVTTSLALAESVVFSENFDDGDWTANPLWTVSPADPSVTISNTRCVSAPYSLKIAASSNTGALKTSSGLIAANEAFTCTFNIYIESIAEEGIPFCLQDLSGSLIPIIFLLPNGKVQLAQYSSSVWTKSDVPSTLSYGQWHSFKIVFDGVNINLYIDGHTTPDASIVKSGTSAPSQLVIGNFGNAHTGTFYVDDLTITAEPPPPPTNPGKIYVQFCSDTSTDGLGTNNHYNTFPVDDYSYVSPTGQAATVMAESYRNAHRDSLGNPLKLTWYMLCGSIYAGGITTSPIFPYELMMDNHGAEIARWGDEMAYHYHTWFWDGTAWNQAAEFTPCQPDFEQTVAHLVLDRDFYPCSFRAGWNWMSDIWENYLDDWFPYRFEGASPLGNWVPYHPSVTDWKSVGSQRGWECWYDYTPSQTAAKIEAAFAAAYLGKDQVMTLWSHLKETDFPTKIDEAHNYLAAAHTRYPSVEFEYLTGREAMLKWRQGTDTTPPVVSVSTSDLNGVRTATFSTNEAIYQRQPFVALKNVDGTYTRLDCTSVGTNQWQVSYSLADTSKVSVAVTDWFGNATVQALPVIFRMSGLRATPTSTSVDVTWETNIPGDSQVTYQPMPSGAVTSAGDSSSVSSHHMTLIGLQPGQVYKIDAATTNAQGERITQTTYVLTNPAEPVIVDNSDSGFAATGSWTTGNTAGGRYGADYRYVSASATGTAYADWTWQAPSAGLYRISVWWSQGSNRCTAATYWVIIGANEYPKVVNQQNLGGQWNEHGVYSLDAGQTVKVRLYNRSSVGNMVIADAARFEPAYTLLSSGALSRLLPDGAKIALPSAVVTGVFDGEYYIQESTGLPGIKVIGSGVVQGATVQVSGLLSTVNGERVVTNPTLR